MKKILSCILVLTLVLSLCACGGGAGDKSALQVGYGRADITPTKNTPLGGYGNASERLSNGFLDPLYVTCLAFADSAGNTVLLFSQDLLGTNSSYTKEARASISKATGVAEDHIFFASTHTHSSPTTSSDHPATAAFKVLYQTQVVKAAQAAMADLADATLYVGSTVLEGMNFIRHYTLDNGTIAGSNFGDFSSGKITGHAAENDPEMQILKIDRADEAKRDILVMNWQAHPCFTDGGGKGTDISADFIGTARVYVESQTGCHFAYFTGAAGNHNANSRIDSEQHGLDYSGYGQALGKAMIEKLDTLTKVEGTAVKAKQMTYEAEANHEDEHLIEQARQVIATMEASGTSAAAALAKELGFSSRFHASSVISRAKKTGAIYMELNAVTVGNFAFIAAPYEMFAVNGVYIKEHSPADQTFIITCANESHGYIPSMEAFEYGCYESHTCDVARGTAEKLQDTFVEMITELKG